MTKPIVKMSREECAEELQEAWRELRQLHDKLKVVDEQFKRGQNAGPHADATFTLGQALKDLDENWSAGRTFIRKMRTAIKNRLKTKANDV